MTEETTVRRKRAPRKRQDIAASTNPDALLTVDTVAALIGCRPDTVRKWVTERKFPEPIRLADRHVRWRAEIVNQWMRDRAAGITPQ